MPPEKKLVNFEDQNGNIEPNVYTFEEADTNKRKDSSKLAPPILLLHELPGLSQKTLRYAETLTDEFTVYVPLLLGDLNQDNLNMGLWEYLSKREWAKENHRIEFYDENGQVAVNSGETRNITHWLREVVQDIAKKHQGQPIGVIGMCLTGSMPLALLDNPNIRALVIAQPSLPLMFWGTKFDKASLDLSKAEEDNLKRRMENNFPENPVEILGIRFEGDCISRAEKFETLKDLLREVRAEQYFRDKTLSKSEYDSKSNPYAHSTLVGYFKEGEDAANQIRARVKEFLKEKLIPPQK